MDDIEDLVSERASSPQRLERERNVVFPKRRAVGARPAEAAVDSHAAEAGHVAAAATCSKDSTDSSKSRGGSSSFVPGNATIYTKTWGCGHNTSDGEYMAGLLAERGYKVTQTDKMQADVWLLNSCTVKTPAEHNFNNDIMEAQKLGKKVILAGCVPQGQPNSKFAQELSVVGTQQIDRVVEVVEEALQGRVVRHLGQRRQDGKRKAGAALSLPKIRKNPLIEIIPINTGCLNRCTYCKTKHARGDLVSYPPEEIVARVREVLAEGVVEIWLTSEDTGAYGRDIGVTLPQLLWQIVKVLPATAMLRLGMTNPPYILEHLEEMAKIMQHPQVYSFFHVPVQSGSDAILGLMKREYSRADFCHVVDFLRQRVPDVTIATDIICGFPTESEEDFEETMELCRRYKFPSLFINQFFPRPGTPAARMQRVDPQVVKERTKKLSEFFRSYSPYVHKVDRIERVLVTEEAADQVHLVGHNKSYDQVLIPQRPELMGKFVTVRYVRAEKFCLIGELCAVEEQEWSGVAISAASTDRRFSWPQAAKLVVLAISVGLLVAAGWRRRR